MDEERKEETRALNVADLKQLRTLGKGATSRVYLCEHGPSRRLFALKKINKGEALKNKTLATQAKREREALVLLAARGDHPFLARFYGAYKDSTWLYYILEHVDGGPLSSHLRNSGKLSNVQVEVYIAQMVLAVKHIHKSGILHRDIKANNVLVCHGGQQVKLIDFGRAKHLPCSTSRTDTFLGIAHHTAPEAVVIGSAYGAQVDWWALGVLCFELAFGEPPVSYAVRGSNEITYLDVQAVLDRQVELLDENVKCFITAALIQVPEQREAALSASLFVLNARTAAQKEVTTEVISTRNVRAPKEVDDPFRDF